jgi:hypothetical protein
MPAGRLIPAKEIVMEQKKKRTKEQKVKAIERSIRKFGDYDGKKKVALKELGK